MGRIIGCCNVSAETGDGIDGLLERILLESEMLELKANPNRPANGYVVEAQMEGNGSNSKCSYYEWHLSGWR